MLPVLAENQLRICRGALSTANAPVSHRALTRLEQESKQWGMCSRIWLTGEQFMKESE